MQRLCLTRPEIATTQTIVGELTERYHSAENPEFLNQARIFADELPRSIRQFVNEFRLQEWPDAAIAIISGYPMDEAKIGRTPPHWEFKEDATRTVEEQMLLVLYGSLLGDVFGWSTQQNGYIVHDILPILGHEYEQLGSGSEGLLWWHTEEAFHPYRCDYLGLMCMRNPNRGPTTVAYSKVAHQLEQGHLKILFEPRFTIRPDESHLEKNKSLLLNHEKQNHDTQRHEQLLERAYQKIHKMNSQPEPIGVLFGDPNDPYMRLDPYFMKALDAEAQTALNALCEQIDEAIKEVVLEPGDVCLIDNYRSVHGRKPFKANYNGNDRWLKRINITRDLRKSRDIRAASAARVVY